MKGKNLGKKLFVLGVVVVGVVGALTASTEARILPGHCICPDVYKPVLCPNGLTYSNACRASCAGQSGCIPADTF